MMKIRPATTKDAAALAALSSQLGYPATPEIIARRLLDLDGRPDEHAVLVALDQADAVIGWTHVSVLRPLEMQPCGEILGLIVDEHARTVGVGRQLVAAAEAWARTRGFAEIVVRSNAARTLSHPFYERIGYQRLKSQHYYQRPL